MGGAVVTLLATVALVGIPGTAHAEEPSMPGIDLPVPATDGGRSTAVVRYLVMAGR